MHMVPITFFIFLPTQVMNRVGTMVPLRHGTQTIPCSYLFCSHCPLSHFCCLFIIISFLAKLISRLGDHGGTRTPLPLGLFERFAYPPLAPTYFPLLQHCVLCSSGRMNTLARGGSIGLPEMPYCPPKHALGGLHLRPEQIVQSCPQHLLGDVAKLFPVEACHRDKTLQPMGRPSSFRTSSPGANTSSLASFTASKTSLETMR